MTLYVGGYRTAVKMDIPRRGKEIQLNCDRNNCFQNLTEKVRFCFCKQKTRPVSRFYSLLGFNTPRLCREIPMNRYLVGLPRGSSLYLFCLFRQHVHEYAVDQLAGEVFHFLLIELYKTGGRGEKVVIASLHDIFTRVNACAFLANQDVAG